MSVCVCLCVCVPSAHAGQAGASCRIIEKPGQACKASIQVEQLVFKNEFFFFSLQISRVHNKSAKLHAKAKMADFKLTFVPLIFLLLRMWTLFLAIPHCYLSLSDRKAFRRTSYNAVFVLLSVSKVDVSS